MSVVSSEAFTAGIRGVLRARLGSEDIPMARISLRTQYDDELGRMLEAQVTLIGWDMKLVAWAEWPDSHGWFKIAETLADGLVDKFEPIKTAIEVARRLNMPEFTRGEELTARWSSAAQQQNMHPSSDASYLSNAAQNTQAQQTAPLFRGAADAQIQFGSFWPLK